ncbi:MAG TPA: transporter [Candidatus Sulfotelmatobacter sp.]
MPTRPTLSTSTDTTECGVVEAEYGFEHFWVADGSHRQDFTGGLRLGITPNMDLHWASIDYLSLSANGTAVEGFGDTWVGVKYRFFPESTVWPGLGAFYQVKIPSGSEREGLGSGEIDHSLAILISKDFHPVHFDFNVIPTLIGRKGSGFDRTLGFALAATVPVRSKLSLILEPYGYTAANPSTPGFASLTGAVSYQVRPRFFLDAGADAGVTEAAPHKRLFTGFTYAIGNAFSWFSPERGHGADR